MDNLSVTSKGQVTIPKDVRQKLGIRTGSKVQFHVVGDHAEMVRIGTPANADASGFGLLTSHRQSALANFDIASMLNRSECADKSEYK